MGFCSPGTLLNEYNWDIRQVEDSSIKVVAFAKVPHTITVNICGFECQTEWKSVV